MTFFDGVNAGLGFCTWSLQQGRPLPERITRNTTGFNSFQLGFVTGVELAHVLSEWTQGRAA